jgi:hypothetical protein
LGTFVQSDGNNLNFKLTYNQIWEGLPKVLDKNSEHTLKCKLSITNVFGDTATEEKDILISFKEAPTVKSYNIYAIYSEATKGNITNWEFLKEGMPLFLDLEFTAYNSNPFVQVSWKNENG